MTTTQEDRVSRTTDAIDALRTIPLFGGCTDTELDTIARATERATYEAGEHLMEQGRPGYEFFVLIEGTADVTRDGTMLTTLGPGDFVGELALLDRAARNATVTATTSVRVLLLGYQEFWGVISAAPGLDKKLLVALARRVRELESPVVA